jgi:hypothetical protein
LSSFLQESKKIINPNQDYLDVNLGFAAFV